MDYSGKRLFDIPHFDRYYITTDGVVIKKRDLKQVSYSQYLKKSGFSYLLLDKNDTRIRISINELLMLTFYGYTKLPIKENIHVDSNDYDFIDINNLSYDDTEFRLIENFHYAKFTIEDMEYREIPDTNHQAYINKDGAIYNYYTHKFIKKVYEKEHQYPHASFTYGPNENDNYGKNIHRILGIVFLPNYNSDLIVNHKDAHKYNSYVSNLEMVTNQDNIIHAAKMGLIKHAYNAEEIHRLCKLLEDQTPLYQIPSKMGWNNDKALLETISRMIYRICVKGEWKDISSQYNIDNYKKVNNYPKIYSEDNIKTVCRLIQDTEYTNKEISKITGIPRDSVQAIRAGKQWKNVSDNYNLNYMQKKKNLSEDEYKQIFRYMEDPSMNNEAIANKMNLALSTIISIRNGSNSTFKDIRDEYNIIQAKKRNDDLSEEVLDRICQLILLGQSDTEIANAIYPNRPRFRDIINEIRIGKSYNTFASQYGIPCDYCKSSPNKRNYVTKEQYQEIDDLIKKAPEYGNTLIGCMVGVPWHVVRTRRAQIKNDSI